MLTIAGLTSDKFVVKIIDEYYQKIDFVEEVDLVGITAMTQQAYRAYEIADIYRKKNIPVVMGGIHASVLPDEALKHVDTVIIGEAEELWGNYLEDLINENEKEIYKSEKPFNLDNSPFPRYNLIDFSAFKDSNNYFNYYPVQATRGCPHDCSFCAVTKIYGKKIRKKKINHILNEIKLIRKYDNDGLILFVDDNLFVDKKFSKALLSELIPLKIKYFAQTDINFSEDEELLDLAYRSGCQIAFIGFESLNPKSLGEVNLNNWKKNRVDKYSERIKRIQEHGIVVFGAFVIGFENDSLLSFKEIRDFVISNNIPGQFTILTPIPGSRIYNDLKERNKLYEDVFWNKCGFYNLTFKHDYLNAQEAERELIWLYDEVFSMNITIKRLLYIKNIYKELPPRWE